MNSPRTTNYQLLELCYKFGVHVNDICPKDKLFLNEPESGGYIINLQDSDDGGGTHWIALYFFPTTAAYFDSFGIDPPLDVIRFCERYGADKILISVKEIQNINGGHCGQYCVDFLRRMQDGKGSPEMRYYDFLNYYDSSQ